MGGTISHLRPSAFFNLRASAANMKFPFLIFFIFSVVSSLSAQDEAKKTPKTAASDATVSAPGSGDAPRAVVVRGVVNGNVPQASSGDPKDRPLNTDPSELLVIETDVGLDQIREEKTIKSLKPSAVPAIGMKKENPIRVNSEQIINLNRSLRHSIEDNVKLQERNQSLQADNGGLRGQREIQGKRIIAVGAERDAYKKRVDQVKALEALLGQSVESYHVQAKQRQTMLQKEIEKLRSQAAQSRETAVNLGLETAAADLAPGLAGPADNFPANGSLLPGVGFTNNSLPPGGDLTKFLPPGGGGKEGGAPSHKKRTVDVTLQEEIAGVREKSMAIIEMIDRMDKVNETVKIDEAKVHYNMGNMFFNQGKYDKARAEYQESVNLLPKDPNAHFNLAFVSSEYLNDQRTALKHYKEYLALVPHAEDAPLVKEKIVEAELSIKAHIDSPLECDWQRHETRLYNQ